MVVCIGEGVSIGMAVVGLVVGLVVVWLLSLLRLARMQTRQVEYTAYVGRCYSRGAPGSVHGKAKLIFRCVPGTVVEAIYAGNCASCELV